MTQTQKVLTVEDVIGRILSEIPEFPVYYRIVDGVGTTEKVKASVSYTINVDGRDVTVSIFFISPFIMGFNVVARCEIDENKYMLQIEGLRVERSRSVEGYIKPRFYKLVKRDYIDYLDPFEDEYRESEEYKDEFLRCWEGVSSNG